MSLSRPAAAVRTGLVCALSMAASVAGLGAQSQCQFGTGTGTLNSRLLEGGRRITYVSTPHLVCDDGVEIWADSSVAFTSENWAQFLGDVRFIDRIRELESDEARYYTRQGRLEAQGSLLVRDPGEGTVIENGELLYLRRGGIRFEEEITVTTAPDGTRPRMSVVPRPAAPDSAAARPDTAGAPPAPEAPPGPPEPFMVESDRLELRGQGYFKAIGDVRIERDSVLALADSAEYTRESGVMVLDGGARVLSGGSDLSGRRIDLVLTGGELREARAHGEAVLVGADVRMEAPRIRIYLIDGRMERLVAVPESPAAGVRPAAASNDAPARPVALTEAYRLTADSIDVTAPGEVLERIFAAGRARSESAAREDSLDVEALPPLARKDWIEGDTVIADFVPVRSDTAEARAEPRDSAGPRHELDRLTARVAARSLYRLAPADSAAVEGGPPALHYVTAEEIVVVMSQGEVERMEVEGLRQGVHLEPLRPRTAPPDTAVTRPAAGGTGGSGRGGTDFAHGPSRTPGPALGAAAAVAHVISRERQR